jgi:hypothetical protein
MPRGALQRVLAVVVSWRQGVLSVPWRPLAVRPTMGESLVMSCSAARGWAYPAIAFLAWKNSVVAGTGSLSGGEGGVEWQGPPVPPGGRERGTVGWIRNDISGLKSVAGKGTCREEGGLRQGAAAWVQGPLVGICRRVRRARVTKELAFWHKCSSNCDFSSRSTFLSSHNLTGGSGVRGKTGPN